MKLTLPEHNMFLIICSKPLTKRIKKVWDTVFVSLVHPHIYILFIECLSGLRIQTRHWLGFAGLLAARRFGVEILGPVTIEDVQSCIIDSELVAYDQAHVMQRAKTERW